MRTFAKVLVTLATLMTLISIGGLMGVGVFVLVPLHGYFARRAVRIEFALWVVLALLSIWEAAYIYTLVIGGSADIAIAVVALAGSVLFVRLADNRLVATAGPEASLN
jgi:hypothetical protein